MLVLASILVLCCCGLQAKAQGTCPFLPSESVQDTLEAGPYYPLKVGNTWEYVIGDGVWTEALIRIAVVGDTLIEGDAFYQLRRTYHEYGVPVVHAHSLEYLESVTDTTVVRIVSGIEEQLDIRLNADFKTCYTRDGNHFAVDGGYERSFTIPEQGGTASYTVPAIKEFNSIEPQETFAYGIGRIRIVGDPFIETNLVFARIDGVAMGTPIDSLFDIRVGVDDLSLPRSSALHVYPNPARSRILVQVDVDRPVELWLRLYDVLGREVTTVFNGEWGASSFRSTAALDRLRTGLYFVVATSPQGLFLAKSIVIVQ